VIIFLCIKFHLKGCTWWIIVTGLRVLLIMHYLIREILVDGVLDVHISDIKKIDPNIVTIYLLQKTFMEKYLCWYEHEEPYVPYKTMVERMVRSAFNSSNVCGVVDDNSNPYKSMVMDTMRFNKESNANATRFLDLLTDSNGPL